MNWKHFLLAFCLLGFCEIAFSQDEDEAFTFVEVFPQFPGGEEVMTKFLADSIRYPKAAFENNIEGRVFLRFVVEKNGSLTGFKITRDIGFGCGEEAIRVVKSMPKWIPGTQSGRSIRAERHIFVTFKLNGSSPPEKKN